MYFVEDLFSILSSNIFHCAAQKINISGKVLTSFEGNKRNRENMKDVDTTSNPSEAKPESVDESRPEAPVEKPVSERPGKRKKQQEFAHAKRR